MESIPWSRMLIINSNEVFNRTAVKLLSLMAESVEVVAASTPAEARKQWRRTCPDCVLVSTEQGCVELSRIIRQELPNTLLVGMPLFTAELKHWHSENHRAFNTVISKEDFQEQIIVLLRRRTSL